MCILFALVVCLVHFFPINTDTKKDLRRGFISLSAGLGVFVSLLTAGLDTRPVTVCGSALTTQRTPFVDPSVVFTHRVGAGTVGAIAVHVRLDTVLRASRMVGTGSPCLNYTCDINLLFCL